MGLELERRKLSIWGWQTFLGLCVLSGHLWLVSLHGWFGFLITGSLTGVGLHMVAAVVWMFVSPPPPAQFICWYHKFQGDCFRMWGFGRWLGQEGRAFMIGVSALKEEAVGGSLTLAIMWGPKEKGPFMSQKVGPLPDTESVVLILGLPASRITRSKTSAAYSPPCECCFLVAPWKGLDSGSKFLHVSIEQVERNATCGTQPGRSPGNTDMIPYSSTTHGSCSV